MPAGESSPGLPRVVLVTGVSRYFGGRLAARLAADPRIERVLGVDTVAPDAETAERIGRTEFVRADIRNPLIAKVIADAGVDTVAHMSVLATPSGLGGRASMKELNVIGSMQLLAACQKAPTVRKLGSARPRRSTVPPRETRPSSPKTSRPSRARPAATRRTPARSRGTSGGSLADGQT